MRKPCNSTTRMSHRFPFNLAIPPPFFHWKFCSVHFLLLFILVFPIGAWAQGDGNMQLVLPQNLVGGRNQIDLSQDFPVNGTATIFKEHGSSGDIPSEHSLEDSGSWTNASTYAGESDGIHMTISPNVDPPDPPSYLEAFGGATWINVYWTPRPPTTVDQRFVSTKLTFLPMQGIFGRILQLLWQLLTENNYLMVIVIQV